MAFLVYATVFGIAGYIATALTIAVFGIFLLVNCSISLAKYYVGANSKLINVNI